MVTRQQQVTKTGFQLRVQTEESQEAKGAELVSWFVMNKGASAKGGVAVQSGVTHEPMELTWFGNSEPPSFFGAM